MLQYSNLNRVMEPETISKNGASPKSQKSRKNPHFFNVLFFLVIAIGIGIIVNAQVPSTRSNNKDKIIGVWKFSHPDYNILNIITKGYDVIIWFDSSGKEIDSSHGGSYTFDGETCIGTTQFGTKHWQSRIGEIGVLKVRFENNYMYTTGKVTHNGVETNIKEVWERIE